MWREKVVTLSGLVLDPNVISCPLSRKIFCYTCVMQENIVLTSAKYVMDNAAHVHVNEEKLQEFFKDFTVPESMDWMNDSFDLSLLTEDEHLMLPVVFNSISFCYWGDPYWQVTYKDKTYDRASWSMVASILRSKDEGKSLLNIENLKNLTREDITYILRGNTEIPLLDERLQVLNTVGSVIAEKYDGDFKNIILEANGDAIQLVQSIINNFAPWFDDSYLYKGEVVYFNKRSQAMVESINSVFKDSPIGQFTNIDKLSALADYIIPNVLRGAGIIQYSEVLAEMIDSKIELGKGGEYEIEIRASVVMVMEKAREYLKTLHSIDIQAATINDYLWVKGVQSHRPFHLTKTFAY